MLPATIENFINQLISETRNGVVKWNYHSDEDLVETTHLGMKIRIDYKFDFNMEVGVQRLNIVQHDGKHFFFPVSEYDGGYTVLKILYNEAQASDFSF